MQPTPTPPDPTPPATTPRIPQDQDEKASLAVFLATAWLANPDLIFRWTTQAAFAVTAEKFQQVIGAKTSTAALRADITLSLTEADDQIDEGLPYLKAALLTKFKKGKDKAMYPQFGIITRNGGYELPIGHTERALALKTLVTGLNTHGLTAGDYGTTFWGPLAAAYQQGTTDAKVSAASVSALVGTKDALEVQVDLVLTKMLVLLEAQYPDEKELAAKRRELGYLKEFN
ncbi:hypothetical protein [Hymenobacter terrenus]|uniref:hypothetical protein n=1 Tax=Hymenobacter terrenus TaxID=1629124 RepID=UPI00061967F9|nr:hypothetical protein [Hymenobacter terrenus]